MWSCALTGLVLEQPLRFAVMDRNNMREPALICDTCSNTRTRVRMDVPPNPSAHPQCFFLPCVLTPGCVLHTTLCVGASPLMPISKNVIASIHEGANWAAGGRRRTPARIVNCGLTNFEHTGVSSPAHTYVCQALRLLRSTNTPDTAVLVAEKRGSESESSSTTSCEHSRIVTEAHVHI